MLSRKRLDKGGDYGALGINDEGPGVKSSIQARRARALFPGVLYLVGFVMIFSANSSVLVRLFSLGFPFKPAPILLAGNAVGAVTLVPFFHKDLRWQSLKRFSLQTYGWMAVSGFFSNVLGNMLYLQGLRRTSVTAMAVMRRLEAVNFLAAAAIFLGHLPNCWVAFNAFLTLLAVVAALLYPRLLPFFTEAEDGSGPTAGNGQHSSGWPSLSVASCGYIELYLGAWSYTVSLLVIKRFLSHVPVGILASFKVVFGTALFFALSVQRHRPATYDQLTDPKLWLNMAWYGPVFVTSVHILWFSAVQLCSPAMISLGLNATFIMTVTWGVVLAGQWPDPAETVAGVIILVSVISGVAETVVNRQTKEEAAAVVEEQSSIEEGAGEEEEQTSEREEGEEEQPVVSEVAEEEAGF